MSVLPDKIASGYNKATIFIFIAILLTPVLFYFSIIAKYSLNIPNLDDYDAILGFLVSFLESSAFTERAKLIFSQHNEHRIFFDRTVALVSYYLFGSVNFKTLIIIGNLGLVAILLLLLLNYFKSKKHLYYFLPVPFILFQLQNHANATWAMASLQNFYVIFFAFLTIYLLGTSSRWSMFVFACFAALFATYTSGNGMFVFVPGMLILLFQKRYWPYIFAWFLTGLTAITFYFTDYVRMGSQTDIIATITEKYKPIIAFVLYFLSSTFNMFDNTYFSLFVLLGLVFISAFIFFIYKGYYKLNPVLMGQMLFLIITAAVAALSRADADGISAFASRYTINASLYCVLLYLAFVDLCFSKELRYYFVPFFIGAIFVNILHYQKYLRFVTTDYETLMPAPSFTSEINYTKVAYPIFEKATNILDKSAKEGIYTYPYSYFLEASTPSDISLIEETHNITSNFEVLSTEEYFIINNGWAILNRTDADNSLIYVVLLSATDTFAFNTRLSLRPDVSYAMNHSSAENEKFNYDNSGFSCVISKKQLKSGVYKVGIYIARDGQEAFQISPYFINNTHEEDKATLIEQEISIEKNDSLNYSLDSYKATAKLISIKGWAHIANTSTNNSQVFVVLTTGKKNYVFTTVAQYRPDVTTAAKAAGLNLDRSGFTTSIPTHYLTAGKYLIGIYIQTQDKKKAFEFINKEIEIQ